jgi:rhomboid family GlyGly-CTERM serine protease
MLALACLAAGLTSLAPLLAYDRSGILAGEIWRLWSGHLVHFSSHQLLLDVGTLLVAGWLAEHHWRPRFTAIVVLLGMPAISAGFLLLSPHLGQYRGVSGVAMLLALAAATRMWNDHPEARPGLAVLGAGLAIKTLLDALGMTAATSSLPANVSVAWQAHVYGAVIGWIAARCLLGRTLRTAEARAAGDQKL